jgi:anti-sigma factor RsiW
MMTSSSECRDRELLINALADGELDALHAAEAEEHIKTCKACAALFDSITAHRARLIGNGGRIPLPPDVKQRLLATVSELQKKKVPEAQPNVIRPPLSAWRRYAAAAAILAAACIPVFLKTAEPSLETELVAGHVRSLLASHLVDVPSSDRHTVKPWFLGKLNFAPPVADLTRQDFPLIGGRLDYIGGKVVAALVYKRRGHIINLYIWPSSSANSARTSYEGYNVLSWSADGFQLTAVSDLGLDELTSFEDAWRAFMGVKRAE